ncbi:hypothetical protein OAI26_03320 [Sulfitobacter sp.]|nr:hypothetical protein [Sulfitobacter sp.]
MKKMIVLAALMLAACGVDGEPIQPTGGVNVTLSGNDVGLGANLGLTKGPLRIGHVL